MCILLWEKIWSHHTSLRWSKRKTLCLQLHSHKCLIKIISRLADYNQLIANLLWRAIQKSRFACPSVWVDIEHFNFVVVNRMTTNRKHFVVDISKRSSIMVIDCIGMIDVVLSIVTEKSNYGPEFLTFKSELSEQHQPDPVRCPGFIRFLLGIYPAEQGQDNTVRIFLSST